MPLYLGLNFTAPHVLWRLFGLIAVIVSFICLALIEFVSSTKPKTKRRLWLLIAVCVIILLAVLINLKGA